ncbi:MAG: isopenicillin N synthase family oxygenase [Proteobacteria bacterium]|nr:isopenicillin N synthase family oxygenase [Pseudomonadota bacterium]
MTQRAMSEPARVEAAIPVIDLRPFYAGGVTGRRAVAREIKSACETIGFFMVAGHGVPPALLDDAFAVSREFFDLPVEEKLKAAPVGEVAPRGYAAFEQKGLAATLGVEAPKDLREQFMVGTLDAMPPGLAQYPDAAGCYSPNVWPLHPARYRAVFTELYRCLERQAADLMRAFALALALPEDHFSGMIDHHFSVLGSNHYPALARDPLPGQLRTGAHTDFGSLTMVAPSPNSDGLEAMIEDGVWAEVKPRSGCLVVNIGDMMARWTNDRWRSTLHRVMNPPPGAGARSRRQSIAFFCHPNFDAMVSAFPSCVAPDERPRYEPILAGRHMRAKMEKRSS